MIGLSLPNRHCASREFCSAQRKGTVTHHASSITTLFMRRANSFARNNTRHTAWLRSARRGRNRLLSVLFSASFLLHIRPAIRKRCFPDTKENAMSLLHATGIALLLVLCGAASAFAADAD